MNKLIYFWQNDIVLQMFLELEDVYWTQTNYASLTIFDSVAHNIKYLIAFKGYFFIL